MLEIQGFKDYFITEEGLVYSQKQGKLTKMKPYLCKNGYLNIKLIDNNGKRKACLVHRLVAEAFIPNPNHFSDVDHIDNNKLNVNKNNLQWISHKDNIHKSYKTMSQIRNHLTCKLFYKNKLLGDFQSIRKASKYAHENHGVNFYAINKYLYWGEYKIVTLTKQPIINTNKKNPK